MPDARPTQAHSPGAETQHTAINTSDVTASGNAGAARRASVTSHAEQAAPTASATSTTVRSSRPCLEPPGAASCPTRPVNVSVTWVVVIPLTPSALTAPLWSPIANAKTPTSATSSADPGRPLDSNQPAKQIDSATTSRPSATFAPKGHDSIRRGPPGDAIVSAVQSPRRLR